MSVQINENDIVNALPYRFTVWLGYIGNRANNKFIERRVRKVLRKYYGLRPSESVVQKYVCAFRTQRAKTLTERMKKNGK